MMTETCDDGIFKEVPSPFCGVGTDDLTIQVEGTTIKVIENGCAVNTPLFEQPMGDVKPRVDGKKVRLKEAVEKASKILRSAKLPLFGGLATDVNGMRAALSLADRCGAVVDNMSFEYALRNIFVLHDTGWMTTTLAEVKNRADLLLVVGCDLEVYYPRFFERYIWTEDSMFLKDTSDRQIVYLGKVPSGLASKSPSGRAAKVLACPDPDLPEVVAVLRALVKGNPLGITGVGGISISELQRLAAQLKKASYGVVAWMAGALDFPQADLTVQTLCEMIKEINQTTRCSGLPLGGKEGDQTSFQVTGWQTGYPSRVDFSAGFPDYDPYLNSIESRVADGSGDVVLWVSAFNVNRTPPRTGLPTIVLGRSGMRFDQEPDVFIPVGTPGLDHAGHAYRTDNVVAVRLKKLRESSLPSCCEVLSAIEQAL
jgi:formylmethanofuran dehydrogenase subunit B